MLVLLILSRPSLPYKRISVSWSLLKLKNIGNNTTDCFQEGLFFHIKSPDNEEGNEMCFQYFRRNCISN